MGVAQRGSGVGGAGVGGGQVHASPTFAPFPQKTGGASVGRSSVGAGDGVAVGSGVGVSSNCTMTTEGNVNNAGVPIGNGAVGGVTATGVSDWNARVSRYVKISRNARNAR